jgi:hypothetical protein
MIAALALMCQLSAAECASSDARAIARAVDAATDDDRLRAVLVVYAHRESHWTVRPRPWSWDARAGVARGPWQLWGPAGSLGLTGQASAWLSSVQSAGLAGVDSSPRRAARRARIAAGLVSTAPPTPASSPTR